MILYYNVIFYPSQMLLHKICKLLWAMTAAELAPLKKALCSMDKPHSQSQSPQVRRCEKTPQHIFVRLLFAICILV